MNLRDQLKAEADEALAALERSADISEYAVRWCAVEQAWNTASINGEFALDDEIRAAARTIRKRVYPGLKAAYDAADPYSIQNYYRGKAA